MPLTDAACRNAMCLEGASRARLSDGEGLFLEVSPAGSKRWFWKFYPDGKESRVALGHYPGVSLRAARLARDAARVEWKSGINPVHARQAAELDRARQAVETFESVAREYHAARSASGGGWGDTHAAYWLRSLERDLFPYLGRLPLAEVSAPLLLSALRRVEARGARRTAHDLREAAGQVCRYGIATGRCERNPAADLKGALAPFVERNMAAVVDPVQVGALMRALDGYAGRPTTRAALVLSALLFQRPGNIRAMEWAEVDLDAALWSIPSVKMKRSAHGKVNGRPHLVPLSVQAVAVLRDLLPSTGKGRYVFPSLLDKERCMSENTVNTALRRMGYGADEMTAHGFRAMARTVMAERLPGVSSDVVESQLAHGKSGPLGTAYDRADYMAQRRELMQTWADYLDVLRVGAKVLPLRSA